MKDKIRVVMKSFRDVQVATIKVVEHYSQQFGLTASQVGILVVLSDCQGIGLTELADKMSLTAGSTSTTIDHLVDHGFVERIRSDEDRRRVALRLTGHGDKVLQGLTGDLSPMIQHLTWAFSAPDLHLDALLSTHQRILQRLKEAH